MLKYLFVVEKPSLSRSIQAGIASGSGYSYSASFFALHGHFMELINPDEYSSAWGKPWTLDVLPMIPSKFLYKVKDECKNDFRKLKEEMLNGGYDAIVNACDSAREGEAIFWTIYYNTGCKLPVQRLWCSDQTPEALSKACHSLRDYSTDKRLQGLRESALCRQEMDWLVGMNLSRAAMLKTRQKTSIGRVKSPTTAIVVDRDLKIENFKPEDYFEIEGSFGGKYKGTWFKDNNTSFGKKSDAENLLSKLTKIATVKKVECKQVSINAPKCYSLTELQRDANKVYGLTALETLNIAQKLYEEYKLTTYPRTESTALSSTIAKEFTKRLSVLTNVPELKTHAEKILAEPAKITKTANNKTYVNDAKLTDHHAIINTDAIPDMSTLSEKEKKVYLLITKRFLSIFLDPMIQSKTTIITEDNGETFKTTGTVTEKLGFNELYKTVAAKDSLPPVKEGETYNAEFAIKAKATTPPNYMTDADLLGAMVNAGKFLEGDDKAILDEAEGLGTTATRAQIIDDLVKRNFLHREGKYIKSTSFGKATINTFKGYDFISPILTAAWEKKLREIEDGKKSPQEFRADMQKYIKEQTHTLITNLIEMTQDNRIALGKCPICGQDVVETKNYYICKGYKKEESTNCTFIIGKEICGKKITDAMAKQLISGKATKQTEFSGKKGKFTACLKYDTVQKKVVFDFSKPEKKASDEYKKGNAK